MDAIKQPAGKEAGVHGDEVLLGEEEEMFASLDEMQRKQEQREDAIEALICGTLYKTYTDYLRQSRPNHVVISDAGEHKCTPRCHLVELKGTAWRVGRNQGKVTRLHVCLDEFGCCAPQSLQPELHAGVYKRIERKVFVCSTTNRCHICTPALCDAEKVDTDTYVSCALTGNVLHQSEMILSHGWIEDNWRVNDGSMASDGAELKGAEYTETEELDRLIQDKREGVPKRKRKSRASNNKKKCGNTKSKNHKPLHTVHSLLSEYREILLQTRNSSSSEVARRQEIIAALQRKAAADILCLLPGSPLHTQMEAERRLRVSTRFYALVEKYIKRRNQTNSVICMHAIGELFRQVTEWGAGYGGQSIQLDNEKADIISQGYARLVIRFLSTLLKHTDFLEREVHYSDFICATMYLQKGTFQVADTIIFSPDAFLICLPSASQLDSYGYGKNCFTAAKSCIQSCIMDAIDAGVEPSLLSFPMSPFHELFL